MTVVSIPLWLQGGTYAADDDRALLRALVKTAGVVLLGTDLLVSQNGTPNMSVNVNSGRAFVQRTAATDFYLVENDALTNLTISASDPTNPRRDLIVARVYDAAFSGALNQATVEVVTGTPAGSPVDPTTPANSFVLARVAVAAAATTVVTANITDLRTPYGPNRPANATIVYTAPGTLTAAQAAGATGLRVRCVGGGGGSGGCPASASNGAAGGGGGGGAYAESLLDISAVTFPVTVTVGTGGAAGASGGSGGAGAASSFAALVAAGGGAAGQAGSSSATIGLVGNSGGGGTPTAGQIQVTGSDGQIGLRPSLGAAMAGAGGAAGGGFGGTRKLNFSNQSDGAAGYLYGGGASGGVSTAAGGAQAGAAGASGIVIVELIY